MEQNYLRVATTLLPRIPPRYSTGIFKRVDLSGLNSALPPPDGTVHGSSSCLAASASFQLVSSFRRAARGQLPFFFKAPRAEQIRGPAQLRG